MVEPGAGDADGDAGDPGLDEGGGFKARRLNRARVFCVFALWLEDKVVSATAIRARGAPLASNSTFSTVTRLRMVEPPDALIHCWERGSGAFNSNAPCLI